MKVTVRADASLSLGSGHIMRCLTLADRLAQQGADTLFISRQLPGEMSQTIAERGYSCKLIDPRIAASDPESPADSADLTADAEATLAAMSDCDWLIVDHYQLCDSWYPRLRERSAKILVIDDLANRRHDCDLLHDQTLDRSARDYRPHTPAHCRLLLGTRHALLRPEFAEARRRHASSLLRTGPVKQLLIALGGSDADNLALDILQWLEALLLQHNIAVMLVAGAQYRHVQSVRDWADQSALSVEIHHNVSQVAPLLARADVAIGASGSSAWERCCLGLPTLACIYAQNQADIAERLARAGASINWQTMNQLHTELETLINHAQQDDNALAAMSRAAADICDGLGAERVVAAMMAA